MYQLGIQLPCTRAEWRVTQEFKRQNKTKTRKGNTEDFNYLTVVSDTMERPFIKRIMCMYYIAVLKVIVGVPVCVCNVEIRSAHIL